MDSKKRIKKVLTVSAILLAVGVLYVLLCTYTSFRIPCLFRLITGFKCPGCGVTGMCLSLLKFDFESAFLHNRILTLMLPFGAVITACYLYRYIKSGEKMLGKSSRVIVFLMIAILLVFGIIRNIYGW